MTYVVRCASNMLAAMSRMNWWKVRNLGTCEPWRLLGSYCSGLVKIAV